MSTSFIDTIQPELEANRETIPSIEKRAIPEALAREIAELEAFVAEKELLNVRDRAIELFALRCIMRDKIAEDPDSDLSETAAAEFVAEALQEHQEEQAEIPLNELEVGVLKRDYNIDFPGRYSAKVLKEMLAPQAPGQKWGMVIVAKYDHNNAFACSSQLNQLKSELGESYSLRIVEAESAETAATLYGALFERFGMSSFSLVLAHGYKNGFTLGDQPDGQVTNEHQEVSVSDQILEQSIEGNADSQLTTLTAAINQYSDRDAPVVMASCSTGAGTRPVAQTIANQTGRTTTAPTGDITTQTYTITPGSSAPIISVSYEGGDTKVFTPDESLQQELLEQPVAHE